MPNGCIEWQGKTYDSGYGKITVKGKTCRAHRVAYEAFIGPIPAGLCVLHTCDNPPCINPAHLWTGTNTDNLKDMARKGRGRNGTFGELHGSAKVTEARVREIRGLYAVGDVSFRELAERFGLSESTVVRMVNRLTWKHVV